MKSKNVIYGVNGMLEYQALIKVGTAKMKIAFTNGSSNEAGRTPATFTTSNPFVQLAIENSKEYKSGLIRKVHTVNIDEDVYIESDHVELAGTAVQEENAPKQEETDGNEDDGNEGEGEVKDAEDAGAKATADASVETVTTKEFSCLDDARDFFETEFGMKRGSAALRTKAAIIATGQSNGIEVVFTD